ncbi:hypothetical protein [Streptomyces sp. NPDC096153]|uniref:hypothetical protein n=1 Tax=Streptomyces sp. NPDC096153 TaxID=3155548 RepID=UPI003320A80B
MPDRLGPIDYARRAAAEREAVEECRASTSNNCLREQQSDTACDTDASECAHGGLPARHTVDTITRDALDALYGELDCAQQLTAEQGQAVSRANAAREEQRTLAEQAEAERDTARRDAGIYSNRLTRLTDGYAEQFRRLEAADAAIERVRDACARMNAAALNADGTPFTPRDEATHRAVRRVLAALEEPKEK